MNPIVSAITQALNTERSFVCCILQIEFELCYTRNIKIIVCIKSVGSGYAQ